MQDVFGQYGLEGYVCSSEVRRVHERFVHWGCYDELRGSEERAEVAVEVILLLASVAGGRRPQLHRVGGDVHVEQAAGGGRHKDQAAQYDHGGVADAKGGPAAEDASQEVLKAFAQRLRARSHVCEAGGGREGLFSIYYLLVRGRTLDTLASRSNQTYKRDTDKHSIKNQS